MTHEEFVKRYIEIVGYALDCSEKGRREGLLALEEVLDQEKIGNRDVFEYGLRFVIDGTDEEIIEKVLSNLIKQEQDEDLRTLKTIQKEAVLMVREGTNPWLLFHVLNSFTDIAIKDDEIRKRVED
jgi:flagellar motor component MotA